MENIYLVLSIILTAGIITLIVYAVKALIQISKTAAEAQNTLIETRGLVAKRLEDLERSMQSLDELTKSAKMLTDHLNNKVDATTELFMLVENASRVVRNGWYGVAGIMANKLTGVLASHIFNKRHANKKDNNSDFK